MNDAPLVCILAAGLGSRVAGESQPKALLSVGGRAAISRIITRFPAGTEFVIAVGHESVRLRRYLGLAHPEARITFVEVVRLQGEGSGPGQSLLECRPHIDRPFILTACDTLVEEEVPVPDHDWIGVAEHDRLDRYDTVAVTAGRVDRWDRRVDRPGNLVFIALGGIRDVDRFFKGLETQPLGPKGERDLVGGFEALAATGLEARRFHWWDTGNVPDLESTRRRYPAPFRVMEKPAESIWFEGDRVIRWFRDAKIASNRARRAEDLAPLVPRLLGEAEGFYAYAFAPGESLADRLDPDLLDRFLDFCCRRLWLPRDEVMPRSDFAELCRRFYRDKTLARLTAYLEAREMRDHAAEVNGRLLPPVFELLEQIDWSWLCDGVPVRLHGDLHTDNVLVTDGSTESEFVLIDWRQEFAGDIRCGDLYYDLAKLHHFFALSTRAIDEGRWMIEIDGARVRFEHARSEALERAMQRFESFLADRDLDRRKVEILSAICFLNMAPLHPDREGDLFHHVGWQALAQALGSESRPRNLRPAICSQEPDPVVIQR